MKRMYVTLGVIFLSMFWALASLGQKKTTTDSQQDQFLKRMQMREEIHRRMMEKLLRGTGPDQDMFKDMEEFLQESMSDSFAPVAQNYGSEWVESSEGRTLVITPKTPDQELDINVNNGMVTVKGKTQQKTASGSSEMSFNNTFSVPGDCDSKRVKMEQKDGKILVKFPFVALKKAMVPPALERRPLPRPPGDIEI